VKNKSRRLIEAISAMKKAEQKHKAVALRQQRMVAEKERAWKLWILLTRKAQKIMDADGKMDVTIQSPIGPTRRGRERGSHEPAGN